MDDRPPRAGHDRRVAGRGFVEAATLARAHSVDPYPEAFTEVVRALLRVGANDRAATFRDLDASTDSVMSAAHATQHRRHARARSGEAVAVLRQAVAEFERSRCAVPAARAMVDLGLAMARLGQDPRPRWSAPEPSCSSATRGFLFEVDGAIASINSTPATGRPRPSFGAPVAHGDR